MDAIFHERQEGSLCAQHCLNALLQGMYFTAVDLADLAQQLDESERETMAEGGVTSEEYQKFVQQASSNFDDSGFFSIQVLQKALAIWGVALEPIKSSLPVAKEARQDPRSQEAFICNFREHWFTVRKLGHQWFNLNSMLTGPELVSDTYLDMFLKQLETEGYSIFVVLGELPDCEADQLLKLCPAVQTVKPKLLADVSKTKKGSFSQDELQLALEASKFEVDENDAALQEVLRLSAQVPSSSNTHKLTNSALNPDASPASATPSLESIRQQRLQYFDKQHGAGSSNAHDSAGSSAARSDAHDSAGSSATGSEDLTEEQMLKQALQMSMQEIDPSAPGKS